MAHFIPRGFGWLPAAPDYRDYSPGEPPADAWIKRLGQRSGESPPSVDLREYFVEVDDQLELHASSAHACISLVQYFERRARGRLLRPARLFLHQNALRTAGVQGNAGVDLRTTLKAMVRCGIPPETHWPYRADRLGEQPDGILYCYGEPYRSVRYVRLDGRKTSGAETLAIVKSFLAAGFPAAFGLAVPNSLERDGQIPYRPTFDSPLGGQAMLAVGYDDRWLRGSRGALLVRSSWGPGWGDEGYGRLPYAYVEERLAVDFFTLLHPGWIDSGEFESPL